MRPLPQSICFFVHLVPGASLPGGDSAVGRVLPGRANLTPLEVAKGDLGVRVQLLDDIGVAFTVKARSSSSAGTIQPGHLMAVVHPDGHDENVTTGQGLAHALLASETKVSILGDGGAVVVGDVVLLGQTGVSGLAHLNELAILDVQTVDLPHDAILVDGKLGDDLEGTGGIDGKSWTIGLPVAHSPRVVGTARLVADTFIRASALFALTKEEAWLRASVRGKMATVSVGLPQIHLGAAGTITLNVGLAKL